MVMELRSSAKKAKDQSRTDSGPESEVTSLRSSPSPQRKTQVKKAPTTTQLALAWMVHFYTGMGLPVNLYAVHVALYGKKDFSLFTLCNWFAILIDATDGTLARAADVKHRIPSYDGAGLDNIIDYITFAFSPALAVCVFSIVPGIPLQLLCSGVILISAGYQFCQSVAKTDDSFVGFPSYWNILVHYIYYLNAPYLVAVALIVFCGVMSFVPVHFVYPTKTKTLQNVTLIGATLWGLMMISPCVYPGKASNIALQLSLLYPVYYVILSAVLHSRRVR